MNERQAQKGEDVMAEKELAEYTLAEIIEDTARRTFIDVHREEFERYKSSLGDAIIIGLRWKTDRDKVAQKDRT